VAGADQSTIAAGSVSVHTGPNINVFAIDMNNSGRNFTRKKLYPIEKISMWTGKCHKCPVITERVGKYIQT
jgi:hypothetical protein